MAINLLNLIQYIVTSTDPWCRLLQMVLKEFTYCCSTWQSTRPRLHCTQLALNRLLSWLAIHCIAIYYVPITSW